MPSESDVLTAFNFVSLLQVDAHAEECFFDKVTAGSKLGLMFQVAEGGFLDIDVRIEGPDGRYGNAGIIVEELEDKFVVFQSILQGCVPLIACGYL